MSLQSLLLLIFGGLALLVFTSLMIPLVLAYRQVATSRDWRKADGYVLVSAIIAQRSADDRGFTDYPRVVYHYEVNGRPYQDDRIHVGSRVGGSGARKKIAKYPTGSRVRVYYDPADPRSSVLEREAPMIRIILLLMFIFVGALGLAAMLVALLGESLSGVSV